MITNYRLSVYLSQKHHSHTDLFYSQYVYCERPVVIFHSVMAEVLKIMHQGHVGMVNTKF